MIIFTKYALLKLKQRNISKLLSPRRLKINLKLFMEFTYDAYADAINIVFRKGRVADTIEIAPEINFDLDARGRPLYLEIIGASEKIGKDRLQEVLIRNLIYPKSFTRPLATAK